MTSKVAFLVVVFVAIFAIPIALTPVTTAILSKAPQDVPAAVVPEAKNTKPAINCADLMSLRLAETTITAAEEIPAGTYTPPGSPPLTNLPAFCRVALTVAPQILIEVWMPKETWNRRYRGEGGGGYAGSISYGGLATGIRAGYATASTDTGHPASAGGTFALNPDGTLNNQLILDFAERSLHEMVRKAKNLMREEVGGPISAAKLNAVTNAAVAACDAEDGVVDGVINDPRKCSYDPVASVCKEGSDPAKCLTTAEAEAVRKIWNGPTDREGKKRLWFGLERGASLLGLAGSAPFPIATTHFQYWIRQNPSFDWRTLAETDFEADFRESQRKFNEVIGTDDDNIQRFRKRGGKMIIWHGEADQLIFPRGTLNYYQRLLNGNGGVKHVEDFARLFMAPGVGHCAGGAGPNPVGVFEAVVSWVENDVAPDKIMASRALSGGGVRTRPLCPYPKTARWTGVGSSDDAANFVCVDGKHNPRDFRVTGPGSN